MSIKPSRETDLIQSLFAPLALGQVGSFGLRDDAAFLVPSRVGHVVTQDQVIEGTHFLASDPLEMVAKRLVRRNLSDLIAKGATPMAAFLSIAWPKARDRSQMAHFAKGLGEDLRDLCGGCPLLGGDTSTIDGPLVASLTLLGAPFAKGPILRAGARAGDVLAVMGVIGDAWLGLQVRLGLLPIEGLETCTLTAMAPKPPPLSVANLIGRYAAACIDVSDGLLGDALQLADNSAVRLNLDLGQMPLSPEAQNWCQTQADPLAALLKLATGGDDYQPLMAISPNDFEVCVHEAREIGVSLSQIGECAAGQGLHLTLNGQTIAMPDHLGWSI